MEIFKVLVIAAGISLGVSLAGVLLVHFAMEPLERFRRDRLANLTARTTAGVGGR